MDETAGTGRNQKVIYWLLVIIAIALVWFWMRSRSKDVDALQNAQQAEITPHELLDSDDVLVDFVDDISSEEREAFAKKFGLTLSLVSKESDDEAFYRGHIENPEVKSWDVVDQIIASDFRPSRSC